jgi:hypothetical protein
MATQRKKMETAVLPAVVKVNGFDVTIRPMTGDEQSWSGAGGTYHWGAVNLSLDANPQRVAMCLLHELLHACIDHSSLRYNLHTTDGRDIEEEIVSQLGFTLAQMIATEDVLMKFIKDAFAGKPIEIPAECMQIPMTGGWCGANMQTSDTKKKDIFKK